MNIRDFSSGVPIHGAAQKVAKMQTIPNSAHKVPITLPGLPVILLLALKRRPFFVSPVAPSHTKSQPRPLKAIIVRPSFESRPLLVSDAVLLVTQLDLPCLRNVVRLLMSFGQMDAIKDKVKIVVNRVGFEDGLCFWGGSRIVGPDGSVLAEAANVMEQHPASIQLRYLQTLIEIASENNSTTIFPVPLDFLSIFSKKA